ncbi:hypothetical protein Q3G72_022695 [Acer saccharum]|nr:hypothetical protein Q3G72_022695 [Acer saccharum]
MENRITRAAKRDQLTEEQRSKHKGFSQWDSYSSIRDHDTILQILIDGRDPNARDIEGYPLPTLVYFAREKRPQYPHNFKAGAMNALIRVSGKISNGQIIHNFSEGFKNVTKNEIYSSSFRVSIEVEFHDVSLFPQYSSLWFIPFAYVISANIFILATRLSDPTPSGRRAGDPDHARRVLPV